MRFEDATGGQYVGLKAASTVGSSFWNLGNHTLAICFLLCIIFVVKASYS